MPTALNIVIFGPPGAGKGTQARKLADALRIPHISTGDIFRDHIARQSPLGRAAHQYSSTGRLVPDDLTIAMVRDRLAQPDTQAGFLLDGFPRNLAQAQALDAILRQSDRHLHHVVNIAVSDDEVRARLRKRAEIEGREDDAKPETIEHRLRTYQEQSEPCLAHYRQRGLVREVDGQGSIQDIFARIQQALA